MQYPLLLICSLALVACAHRENLFVGDRVPFDQRLINFQSLHNDAQIKELRAYFHGLERANLIAGLLHQECDDPVASDAALGKP